MILDADLTVRPRELPPFLEALATGRAEFVNGSRLVYGMEPGAMRFLNLLGNKAFSLVFSSLLDQPVKDTLCGTKVLERHRYEQIAAGRAYFGDFDPFGDFDLLLGAARLNLKIVDLPVRYQARTYGETKISRFRHGWLLLQMAVFAFRKLKVEIFRLSPSSARRAERRAAVGAVVLQIRWKSLTPAEPEPLRGSPCASSRRVDRGPPVDLEMPRAREHLERDRVAGSGRMSTTTMVRREDRELVDGSRRRSPRSSR